eukprot:11196076-Lingulodinium_polyedra.AAC.1
MRSKRVPLVGIVGLGRLWVLSWPSQGLTRFGRAASERGYAQSGSGPLRAAPERPLHAAALIAALFRVVIWERP